MKQKSAGGASTMAVTICIGMLITMLVSILLLLPCAALISSGKLGVEMMPVLTMGVCFLGAMLGALLAWKRMRARAMIISVGGALLAFAVMLLIGFLIYGEMPVGAQALSIFLSLVSGGLLGAAIRLFKKKKRK